MPACCSLQPLSIAPMRQQAMNRATVLPWMLRRYSSIVTVSLYRHIAWPISPLHISSTVFDRTMPALFKPSFMR